MRRGIISSTAVLTSAIMAIVVAGCGPEDEVVQRQDAPPVNADKVDIDAIKPIPQAPKFTGTPKEVAASVDRFVLAFNENDAAYLCTKGYSKEDIAVLDKDGNCVKGLKNAAKLFGGYQLIIKEIRVKGDVAKVQAQTLTKDLANPEKALVAPIGLKFINQDGEWRMSINAAQSLQNAQPSAATGAPEQKPAK